MVVMQIEWKLMIQAYSYSTRLQLALADANAAALLLHAPRRGEHLYAAARAHTALGAFLKYGSGSRIGDTCSCKLGSRQQRVLHCLLR